MGVFKKQYVLAKIESTYGTDPTPTEAADAILCSNINFELLNDFIDYQHVDRYMGKRSGSYQNFIMGAQISFDVELKGEGAALGVAPEIGVLLRACNWTETIVASTSVTYTPNSLFFSDESAESITIYYNQSGILHEINGARGTWTLSGESGKQVTMTFTFQGLHVSAIDSAQSDITVNTTIPPRLVEAQFTIASYSACVQALTMDNGNELVMRECINEANGVKEFGPTDRIPTMNINPETPTLATYDFWNSFENSTEMAVSFRVGTTSLNRATFTIPKAIINSSPNYVDRNNILAQGIDLNLNFDSGNDEISILFD